MARPFHSLNTCSPNACSLTWYTCVTSCNFSLACFLHKPHIGDLQYDTRRGGLEVPGKKIFVVLEKKTPPLFPLNKTTSRGYKGTISFWALAALKGSRQWERRGVWNVSNCPNLARTAAIEVRFSLNFAIVFDFMYFRFRPSKAKWIGDVLTNRQNAANYLQRFFIWNYFVYLPKCCGSGSPPQHCPPLHIWIAASILKTER